MKLRKSLSVLLAAAISLSMLPFSAFAEEAQPDATPPVPVLRDVSGSWAADSIERWVEYGVFQGDQAGNFNPTASMTRAAFAQTLVNLMGYTEKAENTFADVAEDAWYADAVLKAAAAGILQGDGKNANPDGTITREQAAVMLCRAFGISATPGAEIPYADGEAVSTWATAAVAALTERGMVSGVGNNTFAPGVSINRASIAKLLDNMVSEYVLDEARTITGEVKGLVIVAGTGKVTLKDAALSENLIVTPKAQGAALTLSGKTTVPSLDIRGDKTQVVVNSGAAVTAVTAAAQGVKLSGSGAVATVTATAGTVDVTTKGTAVVNQGADKVTASGKTVAQGKTVTTGKGATGHSSGSNSASKVTEATASTPEEMAAALENPDIATIHVTDRAALGIQNNRATLTIQRPGSLTLDFGALKLGSVYLTLNAPNLTALNLTDSGAYPAGAVFGYLIFNMPQATVTNGLACSAAQINAISRHTYVAQDVNYDILMLCPGALSVENGAGEPEVQVYPEYVGDRTVTIRGAVGTVSVATNNQYTPTALPTIALEGAMVTGTVNISDSATVEGRTVKLTLDNASTVPTLYADAPLTVEGEGRVEALIAEADVTLNADVDLLQVNASGLTLTLGENAAVKALETAQSVTLAGTGAVESLDVTAASGTVAVTAADTVAIGQVTKPAGSETTITVNGSAPAILVKAGRPNNLSGGCADVVGKGVIKKVDATMEYASDPDAESWTKITDANLVSSNQIVLAAGTYYVRVAGTPNGEGGFSILPSEAVKVDVPGAVRASAVTITLDAKEVTTALVGDELYATWPEDLPSGQNKAYQWYADGAAIDNQTYYSYTVRAEDVGKTLTVALTTAKSAEDADDATVTSQPVEVGRLSLKTDGLTLTYEGKDVYTLAGTVAESGFTPKALNAPIPALAAALKGCKYTAATLGILAEGEELKQTNPALELFTYDNLGSSIALDAGKWVGTTTLSGTSLDIPLLAGEDVILAVGGKTYTIHNQVAVTNAPGAAVLTEAAELAKDMTVPAGQVLTLNAALTGTGKLLGADATAKLTIGENGSYGSLAAGAYLWKDGEWTEDATLYTVSFNSKGGSAVDPATGLRLNAKVTEPGRPTKDGFTFDGWYKDAGLTDKWDFNKDVVAGDITLYAKWVEAGTAPVLTLGEQLPARGIQLVHNGGTDYTLTGQVNMGGFSGCTDLDYPTAGMIASWLYLPATYVTLEGLLPQADGVRVVQTNDALELFTYDNLDSGIAYDETAQTWSKDKTYDLSAATGDDLVFSLPLLGQSNKQTKGATVTLAVTVGGETVTYTIHNQLTGSGVLGYLDHGNAVLAKNATVNAAYPSDYRIQHTASLTLMKGVTLTIPKGSTLGMEGKLINNGGAITGEGTLEVYDADSLAVALASQVDKVVVPDKGGGNTITVTGDLTVPEGMTLALEEDTVLEITGDLIVNGTIGSTKTDHGMENGALNVTGTITVGDHGAITGGYQGVETKEELTAALVRADVFPRIRLLKSIDCEGPITLDTEGLVLDGNNRTINVGLQIAADNITVNDLTVWPVDPNLMVTEIAAADRVGVYLYKDGNSAHAVSDVKLSWVTIKLWEDSVEAYEGPLCGIHVYGETTDIGTGNVLENCQVTFDDFTANGGKAHERDGIYVGSAAVNLADNTVTKASRGICIQGIGEASETVLEGNRVTIQTGGLGGYAYDLSFSPALCENFGTATSTSNTTALYASLIGLIGKDQVIHARANDKEERWTKADGGEITREYKDGETWTAITGPTAE